MFWFMKIWWSFNDSFHIADHRWKRTFVKSVLKQKYFLTSVCVISSNELMENKIRFFYKFSLKDYFVFHYFTLHAKTQIWSKWLQSYISSWMSTDSIFTFNIEHSKVSKKNCRILQVLNFHKKNLPKSINVAYYST